MQKSLAQLLTPKIQLCMEYRRSSDSADSISAVPGLVRIANRTILPKFPDLVRIANHSRLDLNGGPPYPWSLIVNWYCTVVFWGSIIGLEISAQYHSFIILKLEKWMNSED